MKFTKNKYNLKKKLSNEIKIVSVVNKLFVLDAKH